jgi:hypothetical protein
LSGAPAPTRILSDKITLDKLQGHWVGKYTASHIGVDWLIYGNYLTELYGPGTYSTEIFKIENKSFVVQNIDTFSDPTLQVWEFEIDYFNHKEGIIKGRYIIYQYKLIDGIAYKVKLIVFIFEMRRI